MNIVDVLLPMMGAASLTLGLIHFTVWLRRRSAKTHLLFSAAALSVALLAVCEFLLLHASSPNQYAVIVKWAHLPVVVLICSLVWYVVIDFKVSERLLPVLTCLLRVGSLIPNFLTGQNLNFEHILRLERITFLAQEGIVTPVGLPNPWMVTAQLSNILLIVFLIRTVIIVRRQRDRSAYLRALRVCGTIGLFVALGGAWIALVVSGLVAGPLTLNVTFFGVVLVMGYELGGQVLSSASMAEKLIKSASEHKESQQRMKEAAEAAGLGLWTWELDTGELWFTDQGSGILGLPPGETTQRHQILSRVHPEDVPALRRTFISAIDSDMPYSHEFRYLSFDGEMRWIVAKGGLERSTEGVPLRLRGIIYDITDKRNADELFQIVVDSAQTAMIMADSAGTIVLVNRQAEFVFGYERAELVGRHVEMLLPLPLRDSHRLLRAEFMLNPRSRSMGIAGKVFGIHKNGSSVPIEIGLTPLRIAGEVFVLASITDIAERLLSEQEIALQRDEVAHLSRVALLGEISGSLAHELNQPLTSILSNAQAALRFLKHAPPNLEEVNASLVQIAESDKRASEVIRRLRGMLRKEKPDYEPLDLNSLIQETLRLLHSDLLTRNVSTTLELNPVIPPVIGDKVQIQQVLLNLIVNGSDAMVESTEARKLLVSTASNDDGDVLVSVSDAGSGIAADELERIFMPFVTTKSEGIGLGLAICGTIIRTHRGRLWATNNADRGATFRFTLPTNYG